MREHGGETADTTQVRTDERQTSAFERGSSGLHGFILDLQRSAGNSAVSSFLQETTVQRDGPSAPTTSPGPAATGTDPALIEREDKAIAALGNLKGSSAGTFLYGNPLSPRYQPPNKPPEGTVTLGDLALRPTRDDDKRRSFDNQGQAQAFATVNKGPAGAAVLSWDKLWFAATLSGASGAELSQPNVYRFTPAGTVAAVVGTDGFVFTARDYTPDTGDAALRDRAEKDLARPADAAALRDLVGMKTEGVPGAGTPPTGPKPGSIPEGQEEAFIRSYLTARALEALDQNRAQADKLAADFKPQEGGKIGPAAQELIDKSRALGGIYKSLEDKEAQVGETALVIQEKHLEGKWNRITAKGVTKTYFQWMDDLNANLKQIAEAKQSVLAMSPLLAALVQHEQTPATAKDWAAKLGWERSTVRKVALLHPTVAGVSALWDWATKSSQEGKTWKESELSKMPSEESDKKVAEEFRTKLDKVQQAISRTYARVSTGDTDYLLGMSGLRSRVEADLNRMGPENKAVKDKYKQMLETTQIIDEVIEIVGTIVQIGALFLPGGQFISAAIGMGMQMRTMDKHMEQWDASKAAVDPSAALVDQQQAAQILLFDTLAIAIQAVDLATSVNAGLDDLARGRTPRAAKAGDEATDPTKKHVGDKDKLPDDRVPPLPPTAEAAKAEGWMSDKYMAKLKDLGIPGGYPFNGVDGASFLKACGKDWNKVKEVCLRSAENSADKMAGEFIMHQMIAYREQYTRNLLEEIALKITDETGVPHTIEAIGSKALASDLDYTITGPHAGRVVEEFNAKFRNGMGVESGVAFDSNVYTRSAHLDFPLTPKPGAGKVPMDAKGIESWNSFKGQTMGAASDAEKARLKKVLADAETKYPDDLQARLRYVDNFRQQSASHVRAYENAMAQGVEGPKIWKQYYDAQLAGAGSERALVQAQLDQAAAISAKSEEKVLAELKKLYPNEDWTPDKLHAMAHSKDAAELDKFLAARNRLYEKELKSLDELKKAYETAGSEAERLQIAARINEQQTQALFFASESFQTGGSIISVVQNAQKAGGDITNAAYGQLVANQTRAAMNEQIGNAMAYGGDWPGVVKAGKYVGRADAALKAHPTNFNMGGLSPELKFAIEELDKLKSLSKDSPELLGWKNKHYPNAESIDAALLAHRGRMSAAEQAMIAQMNKNVAAFLDPVIWESIARDPNRVVQITKALSLLSQQVL